MCSFALTNIMLISAHRRWRRLWTVTVEPPLMSISATLMLLQQTATVKGVPQSLSALGSAPCSSNNLATASPPYLAVVCRGDFKNNSITRLTSTPCVVSSRTILRSLFLTAQWITEWPLILLAFTLDPSFKIRAVSSTSLLNTAWKSSSLVHQPSTFVQNHGKWKQTEETKHYFTRWDESTNDLHEQQVGTPSMMAPETSLFTICKIN